jgi:hypothetical protein
MFGLFGVWLGQRLSQRSAASVANRTIEGQRSLAREAALRDYRKQQIAPYIEAAKQRFRIWAEAYPEIGIDDRPKQIELQGKMLDPHFNSLTATYVEIPDEPFRAAFRQFINAEGHLKPTYEKAEVMDKVKEMRLAITELSKAIPSVIYSSARTHRKEGIQVLLPSAPNSSATAACKIGR